MHRLLTRLSATVIALSIPATAIAQLVLFADDSIAGLGLDVGISGADANTRIELSMETPEGAQESFIAQTDKQGKAAFAIPGRSTETAGAYQLHATTSADAASATVDIAPETMDPWTSVVEAWNPFIEANGRDDAEVTVTLRDKFGNVLPGRPVAVVSSRSEDEVIALTTQTNDKGEQHFSFTTVEPGTAQLRAVDLLSGNTIVESAQISAGGRAVGGDYEEDNMQTTASTSNGGQRFYYAQATSSFDVIDHLEITAPLQMRTGEETQKFTVRAVDRNGVTVEDYAGTVRFSSTDPNATFPSSYTFKSRDLGEKSFALALKFASNGEHTFRAEDANDPSIVGEVMISVGGNTGSGNSGNIQVTSHTDGGFVNSLDIVVAGQGPKFANLIVMGGETDSYGTTDANGNFSVPITLSINQRDFTIRVRDDAGRNDSGPIHLILDQEKPLIGTIVFAPENPFAGEQVLVVMQSEVGLARVVMHIADRTTGIPDEVVLTENPAAPGSYQGFFTAPEADMYQPTLIATDGAGNTEEVRTTFTVGAEGLPIVQNLRGSPRVDGVELQWDSVPGDISAYRIYVGDSADNFLYTLDTERITTKVTVKGLSSGKTYFFAVTALQGNQESSDKSEVIESRPLGFSLEVLPEDSALHISWTSLNTDLPIGSFLLQYAQSNEDLANPALREERMLLGTLRDVTVRDLLNGVPYFLRLTPITIAGDELEELAASGEGTPNGDGYSISPRDDVPFGTIKPGDTMHNAPSNPSTGIPSYAWIAAALIGSLGVLWKYVQRRRVLQTQAFLQAVQMHYRQ